MSDVEGELSLASSSDTLDAFDFDQIIQVLKNAAKDAVLTKDYLSYSTVVDIHLSEPGRFTKEERELLLQQLLDSLDGDHELVYEVGWDIPALLIPFVDSDFDFQGPIRSAPCVYKVLKIFEVLALYGNAKELFLKSTELLSSLKSSDSTGNADFAFKFYEIKLYCIFELINSSMRRIHTLYPSRFLAMSVSSFINALYLNPVDDLSGINFIMKRMFVFARNYQSLPKPEKSDLSGEDLKRVEEDENFLQRKLLTALVTESVYMILRSEWLGFTVSYFNYLHKTLTTDSRPTSEYILDTPVVTRLNELALSFDLEPHREFASFVKSSENLVDFSAAEASDDVAFSGELFEKLVVDFQTTFSTCIVNSKTGSVTDSLGGNLLLYTYEISSTNASDAVKISLKQAIAMAIRVIVPGIVHRLFYHKGMVDFAVFWCWYAVSRIGKTSRALELELSSLARPIISTFLQALLYAIVSAGPNSRFRYSALTLLTKVLSAVPEDVAYTFIINSLHECPFDSAKPVLVGVLRVLIISDRTVDELSEKMYSLDLKKPQIDRQLPPPLPSRISEEKSKFITLTKSRADEILALLDSYIAMTFDKTEGTVRVNFEHLSTLSGLLNLLIPLRQFPFIKPETVSDIIKTTDNNISLVETSYQGDDEKSIPLNAVTVLRVALGRLGE